MSGCLKKSRAEIEKINYMSKVIKRKKLTVSYFYSFKLPITKYRMNNTFLPLAKLLLLTSVDI
jgi:hypothetical protein